jgi:hypothetical protein
VAEIDASGKTLRHVESNYIFHEFRIHAASVQLFFVEDGHIQAVEQNLFPDVRPLNEE